MDFASGKFTNSFEAALPSTSNGPVTFKARSRASIYPSFSSINSKFASDNPVRAIASS
ncbi:MAG: hypothetical protein AAGD25_17430 [Cyanobacteria bacterium P01_F01_bin.150]